MRADHLLISATLEAPPSTVPQAPRMMHVSTSDGELLLELERAAWSEEKRLLYAYYAIDKTVQKNVHKPIERRESKASAQVIEKDDLPVIAKWFSSAVGGLDESGVKAARLEKVFDEKGASFGATPAFHYAVETDPESGWKDEIFQWYDVEHMPGLAAVRGCIRARRFVNHDDGPLSLACYDLVTKETLDSASWLAIRATDWSSRARPHFTNTRRTMFQVS